MTSQQVEDLFGQPPKAAVDAALESLTDQNPVIEWIRDNLIPDPQARTLLGANEESRDHGKVSFADADCKLYPNFLRFCHQSKRTPMSRNRFRTTVDDMLTTLKIHAHSKRAGSGYVFEGIRIRPEVDSINTPTNPQNPPHRDEI
jgi:phage/plasmid-associated DNA primase